MTTRYWSTYILSDLRVPQWKLISQYTRAITADMEIEKKWLDNLQINDHYHITTIDMWMQKKAYVDHAYMIQCKITLHNNYYY